MRARSIAVPHGTWILVAVLAAGCGLSPTTDLTGGGSSGTPRCESCEGEDGGQPAPPLPDGATVGFLRTTAPTPTQFLLRGTIPVPPGTFPRIDGRDPFTILDWNGTPLPTQTEAVSRYPREDDGADVVELLAVVNRDPTLSVGANLSYRVLQQPRVPLPGPGTTGIEDLRATESLPTSVVAFLDDPSALEIVTYDCFGNPYVARPLDGTGHMRIMRRGRVQSELRIYDTMVPEPFINGPTGTLPHSFGVHAYVSTLRGQEILGLDLRFNNGHSGRDTTSTLDNPLDKLYFERIEIRVPLGWTLIQDFPDPFFGGSHIEGTQRVWDLVGPNQDGSMHVIRWQGQFHRRLFLSTTADQGLAAAYSQGAGRAFATRGTDPVMGHDYWSWWNRGTARYFPQRYVLPSLAHVGIPALRSELQGNYGQLRNLLENGGSTNGEYPVVSGVLGWGHPYGVSYGGMTSGNEIFMVDGVTTAEAASTAGYQWYVAQHRMHTDRQPSALYDIDGEPTSVERWLVENASADFVPFYCYLTPFLGGSYPDPFGFAAAPRFQINYVQSHGLQPDYEGEHLGFDPHDLQHLIRYTRSAKVLGWLGNDSVAKDDLRMQAEDFNLSYHQFRNDSFGGTQSSGLRMNQNFVASNPHKGCSFGRGEAWGLDCAVAAYAFAQQGWRVAKRPWLRQVLRLVSDGQGSCTGFVQAFVSDKAVNGLYRARQLIEQSITENALQGLRETVFRNFDSANSDLAAEVLIDSLYGFVGEMSWFPGQNGPWRYTGIGPLNVALPIWCSRSQMPGNAWTAGDIETYQDWASFAYGYELTGDPLFLEKALEQLDFYPNLLNGLTNEGTENIENRAALLALVQHLAGQF